MLGQKWSGSVARRSVLEVMRVFIISGAVRLNRLLSWIDWHIQRTYGGLWQRVMAADGYSFLAAILLILALFFLVLGPTLAAASNSLALLILLLAVSGALIGVRVFSSQYLLRFQCLFVFGLSALLLWTSLRAEQPLESFPHIGLALMLGLSLIGGIAGYVLAPLSFRGVNAGLFVSVLPRTELFGEPLEVVEKRLFRSVTLGDTIRAFIAGPLSRLLELCYLPAVLVIAANTTESSYRWGVLGLILSALLLSFAHVHPRLDMLLQLSRRILFLGGQLIISLVLIGIAAGRLGEVSYITTVLDSTPGSLIARIALSAYAFFWLYEYWIGRGLTEALIEQLSPAQNAELGRIRYQMISDHCANERGLWRSIQIHGASRFAIVDEDSGAVEICGRSELFNRLASRAEVPPLLSRHLQIVANYIEQRIRFYFFSLNLLLLTIAFLLNQWLSLLPQEPILLASKQTADEHAYFDLRQALFSSPQAQKPVILLAASGGGTRAALYTSSLLGGLQERGMAQQVVLVSGVSGGGVALSYFAANRQSLLAGDESLREAAWSRFHRAMAMPFIEDVLARSIELRIAGGTRMGALLAESFERRFRENPKELAPRFAQITDLGLILNTALAGSVTENSISDVSLAQRLAAYGPSAGSSLLAGGILAFSNLHATGAPEIVLEEAPMQQLHYLVLRDHNLPLFRAAAASANFPPVFPYAAVDVDKQKRFWVTDGGAVENRGVISLLFAFREALLEQLVRRSAGELSTPPPVHIVVADASASSESFSQDRGFGTAFSASRQFVNQLMIELVIHCRMLYSAIGGDPESLYLHYMAMPEALRSNGGIGTHWMLPARVTLKGRLGQSEEVQSVTLSGQDAAVIVQQLHAQFPEQLSCSTASTDACERADEMTRRDPHHTRWKNLLDLLGDYARP